MNSTNTNWLIKLNSDAEMIDMATSCVSLVITIMIFIRVFDLSGLRKSIRDKRAKIKRDKERKDLENLNKLFQAYQDGNDVSNVTLSDDEAEEKKDEGPMRIARKKKTKAETSV
jgi:lipopolysaccharide export LptBFGC system permease protein LptF